MPNLLNNDGEHKTIRLTARSGIDLFRDHQSTIRYKSDERERAET